MSPIANADYAPEQPPSSRIVSVEPDPILRSNPRAGTLRVDRAQAVERCARLLAADPDMGLDMAWQYVTGGIELGRWRRQLGLEIMDQLAGLLFTQEARHGS